MSIQPAWSYGGGSGEVADGSITREQFADPAGMPTVRRALRLNSGTYASVNWGPSTAATVYRWKQVFHGAPAANFSVLGRNAANRAVVQGLTNGSLSATLLSGAPHPVFVVPNFFLFDGKPHQYELRLGVNSQEAYRDGVLIGSNTLLFSHSGVTTTYIGTTLIGEAPSLVERGTIYDVEFIDPASATNSATFKLDGDFTNSLEGSTVPAAVPNGDIEWETVLSTEGSSRSMLAPLHPPTVRRAAQLTSAGVISYSPPYLNAPYSYSGSARYAGSGLQSLCGRRGPGNFELRVTATGRLELNANGATRATSADGAVPVDGRSFRWECQISSSGLVGLIDGVVVVVSNSPETLATSPGATTFIGRSYAADPIYWQGAIWDFRHTYASSASSSAFFPLDGDFQNRDSAANGGVSNVTDATPSGLITWPTVLSTGGSERAVLAGRSTYFALRRGQGTNQICDGSTASSFELVFQTTDVDELGGFTPVANRFTAPVPGIALIHVGGTFAGATVTDALSPIVQKGTSEEIGRTWITVASGENTSYALSVYAQLAAGEAVRLIVAGVDSSNTLLVHRNGFMAVDFRPTI